MFFHRLPYYTAGFHDLHHLLLSFCLSLIVVLMMTGYILFALTFLSIQIRITCKLIILSNATVKHFHYGNCLEVCTISDHCHSWNTFKINIILQLFKYVALSAVLKIL